MESSEEADEEKQFALRLETIAMAWVRRDWTALQHLLETAQPGRWENKAVDTILLDKPIAVETLCLLAGAEEGGYSEATVRRRLKCSGLTPGEVLARARAERMAELLREEQLTIQAVGRAVGFENKASAAATFRKRFGMSPRAFRGAQRQLSKLVDPIVSAAPTPALVLSSAVASDAQARSVFASSPKVSVIDQQSAPDAVHDE